MDRLKKPFLRTALGAILLTLIFSTAANVHSTLPAASAPPHLTVGKTVEPSEIWLRGLGFSPEKARITLTVQGVGEPAAGRFPVDMVLIVDRSASIAEEDRLESAKSAATTFLKLLDPETDRSSLVSFASSTRVDEKLTFNQTAVEEAVAGLEAGGSTAMGDAIHLANVELTSEGRPEAVRVEILLSDGAVNTGSDPVERAEEAAKGGIVIYAIGLPAPTEEGLFLLGRVAEVTGGKHYPAATSSNLENIYNEAALRVSTLAGRNIAVKEVLPHYIILEGNYTVEPTEVTFNPDGTTTLLWRVDALSIGDMWTASFDVSSIQGGFLPVDVHEETKVTYTDYAGASVSVSFPEVKVSVKKVNRSPVADAGPDQLVEQTAFQGAVVTLDGSGSYDPDGDPLTYVWTWNGNLVSGKNPSVLLPLGETTVTLTVDDGVFSHSDTVKVTVRETALPFPSPTPGLPSIPVGEEEEAEGISVESLFKVTFVPFYIVFLREIMILSVLLLVVTLLVMVTRSQKVYDRHGEEYRKLLRQFMLHKVLVNVLYILLALLSIILFIFPLFLLAA